VLGIVVVVVIVVAGKKIGCSGSGSWTSGSGSKERGKEEYNVADVLGKKV
jgi:hypothetical protein